LVSPSDAGAGVEGDQYSFGSDAGRTFDQILEANDLGDELLVLFISTNEIGLQKLVLEISGKRVRIITHEDRADSFFGGGDKNGAQ